MRRRLQRRRPGACINALHGIGNPVITRVDRVPESAFEKGAFEEGTTVWRPGTKSRNAGRETWALSHPHAQTYGEEIHGANRKTVDIRDN
jgi:hypothetical protein